MSDLRALLTSLGHTEVSTYLQSGNAIFNSRVRDSGRLASGIHKGIQEKLGLDVRCLVRTGEELRAAVAGTSMGKLATDGSRMLVLFLSESPDAKLLAAYDPRKLARGHIQLGERVVYQWCPDGILAAPAVGAFMEKHLAVTVTARNWNTVTKLSTLFGES